MLANLFERRLDIPIDSRLEEHDELLLLLQHLAEQLLARHAIPWWLPFRYDDSNDSSSIRPMDTRLILVEGCPGVGKSSTAQHLWRQLQRAGHTCRWYCEDEQPHPVAPTKGIVRAKGFKEYGTAALRRWRDFASRARRSKEIVVMEGHFFQHLISPLLRADVKPTRISKVVTRTAKFCAPLKPVMLYLHQPDYAQALRRILNKRGEQVEEQYIRQADASIYSRRRSLEGFDGLVQSWIDAREIMEQHLAELDLPSLSIDSSSGDWEGTYQRLGEFLSLPVEAPPPVKPAALAEYAGTYTYQRNSTPRRTAGRSRFGPDVARRVGGLPREVPLHLKQDIEFTIAVENGELVMRDYGWLWPKNELVPVERDVFDLRSWPFQLVFERDRSKAIVAATRRSETTRWQITGQRYPRVEGGSANS
jgi:thymidylate kinase